MAWEDYWGILRRRWWIVALVLVLDILVSGYSFVKSYRHVGYQSCLMLYVADVGAPSLIAAPSDALDTAGQLLAGETAANFYADDILDVSQSGTVASFVSSRIAQLHLPSTAAADIVVSGSRKDRTVNLCVSNPSSASALAAGQALGYAMTTARSRFMGPVAKRTYVHIITLPTVGAAPAGTHLVSLALRLILGVIVALGLALLWDALDPARRARIDSRGEPAGQGVA